MADGRPAQRIGRYEIVGLLATGGMAEVLLARLRGPHGFERPLVIKRILPHLALDPAIMEMFLDEARIIASLRHPNLIHVHELAREGEELFMAMEFLEGESVAGLCRRLASRGEQLDVTLAAYVLAEACAGLHAAHEATSPVGQPLEIVHRDVSPQNIFVEYSGAVHVIDFGIATKVDRVSRTEAGTVRGKFQYLAPEHVQGLAIDRRVDIFALGVVFFELATGRRLYKRDNHAATMMAILKDAVPLISSFRPGVPPELDAICARALAKSPRDRYATAADMRRDLLAFVRARTAQDLPDVLGHAMRALFSDRIEDKSEMLRRAWQGAAMERMPAAEVDISVEMPTVCEVPTLSGGGVAPGTKARRRWLLSAAALLAVLCGVVAIAEALGVSRSSAAAALSNRPSRAAGEVQASASPDAPAVAAPPHSSPAAGEEPSARPTPSPPTRRGITGSQRPSNRTVAPHSSPSSARPAPTLW